MRSYNAAFAICRLENDPFRPERVLDVTKGEQPFGVRLFNNPLRTIGGMVDPAQATDYRLKAVGDSVARARADVSSLVPAAPTPDVAPAPGKPGNTPDLSSSFDRVRETAPEAGRNVITQAPVPGLGK